MEKTKKEFGLSAPSFLVPPFLPSSASPDPFDPALKNCIRVLFRSISNRRFAANPSRLPLPQITRNA